MWTCNARCQDPAISIVIEKHWAEPSMEQTWKSVLSAGNLPGFNWKLGELLGVKFGNIVGNINFRRSKNRVKNS